MLKWGCGVEVNMLSRMFSILLASVLLVGVLPAVQAEADSVRGPLFGGIVLEVGSNSDVTIDLSQAPAVAHVLTATWCEPCVGVEYALNDVSNGSELVILEIHRFTDETEDPFGSESSESWWIDWFEDPVILQPTVSINGGEKMLGTTQASFENLQAAVAQVEGSVSGGLDASWDAGSSTLSWGLDLDANSLDCTSVDAFAHIVERTVYFPDGSNMLGNYTHVVHHIRDVGGSSGSVVLDDLPSAYDDDDLDIVLVFGCWQDAAGLDDEEGGGGGSLSFPGPLAAGLVLISVALSRRLDR